MSVANCRCDECGELYVVTPSGGVCPNGHGGVVCGIRLYDLHKLRQAEATATRMKERIALRKHTIEQCKLLPLCRYKPVNASWVVDGVEGCFRRVAGPFQPSTLLEERDDYLRASRTIARTADNQWCVFKEIT